MRPGVLDRDALLRELDEPLRAASGDALPLDDVSVVPFSACTTCSSVTRALVNVEPNDGGAGALPDSQLAAVGVL